MRYLTPLFLFSPVVFVDRFHEQALDFWDSKDFFRKGVKLGFGQHLCQRCDTFNGCATGDKVVRPLAPISFFIVGDTVFKLLLFVVELSDLAFIFRFIGFKLGNGLSKPFPNDKYAGIGEAARGAAPCADRSDAKQPGLQSPGLSASQSAHTGLAPV